MPPLPTTMTLWRPCGPAELELVRKSGWTAWPPRLPEQPIFYPVLNEDYAIRIARDWNAPRDGVGYVTRFEVDQAFADRYPVQQAGGSTILELWVPAEELDEFNRHIIGPIEVVGEYRATEQRTRDNVLVHTVLTPSSASRSMVESIRDQHWSLYTVMRSQFSMKLEETWPTTPRQSLTDGSSFTDRSARAWARSMRPWTCESQRTQPIGKSR